jgi:cystathionine beta-lyase/cystathionine gamma-synthase
MTFEQVDMTDNNNVEKALHRSIVDNKKSMVLLWIETPSNPQCKITDIVVLTKAAKRVHPDKVGVVVDSTWASPYLLQPLSMGADFTLHSMTKYIAGHHDLLGGIVVAGNTSFAETLLPRLRVSHTIGGGVCSPLDSWLALRGLRTLPTRMKQHCENAMQLATFLSTHPLIERVHYPGLSSHPQHALAASQVRNNR